jgi:hypothetical protein
VCLRVVGRKQIENWRTKIGSGKKIYVQKADVDEDADCSWTGLREAGRREEERDWVTIGTEREIKEEFIEGKVGEDDKLVTTIGELEILKSDFRKARLEAWIWFNWRESRIPEHRMEVDGIHSCLEEGVNR